MAGGLERLERKRWAQLSGFGPRLATRFDVWSRGRSNDEIARCLGPSVFDAPLFEVEPHAFLYAMNSLYCLACGGGLLHEVHRTVVS